MANAYQTSSFAYQGSGEFAYQGTAGVTPPPPVVAAALVGAGKKQPQRRKWRLKLPDGRVVVADTANEYYQQLTRIVRADQNANAENKPIISAEHAEKAKSDLVKAEKPKPFKLTPAEKREAVEWAAEMPTIDLREIADRVWAMRKELDDINDDEDASIVLRWVI